MSHCTYSCTSCIACLYKLPKIAVPISWSRMLSVQDEIHKPNVVNAQGCSHVHSCQACSCGVMRGCICAMYTNAHLQWNSTSIKGRHSRVYIPRQSKDSHETLHSHHPATDNRSRKECMCEPAEHKQISSLSINHHTQVASKFTYPLPPLPPKN